MQTFLEPTTLPPDAIEVGRIGEAWGIKGWFKIIAYSASPKALFSCSSWILLPPEKRAGVVFKEPLFKAPQLLKIKSAKDHSDSVVAQADGIDDRNTAELLKNCRIFIARSLFPKAGKDEFYWVDLMGCEVINREGVIIGIVKDLISTGPQSVIVAERIVDDKTLETLIPFVDAYVDAVSLTEKRITVDWQLDYLE